MKINPSQIAKAMEIYKAQKSSSVSSDKKSKREKDEVVLSDKAQAFQLALKTIQRNDGVNLEKVQRIKKQIEEGQYKVSSIDVAEKMLDQTLSRNKI
ncbi:MAG: flagellar biosynthesis anti-sigma factor FlgM [Caldicoprobacterales bacterium]|nr:flagellar biosynthesis anti-sigma factor FlgM [Clostridiales bacterium]